MRADLPLETIFSIRLATWQALFAAKGSPRGLAAAPETHEAIAEAIGVSDLPTPLARALFVISAFETEAARADLYNAAAAIGFRGRWPDAESPADLVAGLLAASDASDAAAELLEAAQTLRDRTFRPRATLVFPRARPAAACPGGPAALARVLGRAVEEWGATRDFGAVFPVRVAELADGVSFEVAHEGRTTVSVGRARAGEKLKRTAHRPVQSHLLVLEAGGGRLWVTTDCLEAAMPLASIAGRVFFDDARIFLDAPGVDLGRMQDLGAAALSVPEMALEVDAEAVGGTWHSGKSHAITPRGRNFFKALARYKIRIEGGRLELVTVRAKVRTVDGPPQADVVLRPPHGATISEPEHAPALRRFLDRAKITRPDPRLADFFSMQPWIDPAKVWIGRVGEEAFRSLVAEGILRPDSTNRAVAPPEHPHAGRTATAYPLRGGKFLAVSPDPAIAPFVVREEDLVVYVLEFGKLGESIARALGLEGPAAKLDEDGVLACGRRPLATTHVLLFLPTRPLRPATIARLRDAAGHGHAVLVTPPSRMREQGLREIAMPGLGGPWQPLLGEMVRALQLQAYVPTTLYAPPDARVVLHRATERVWLDGVACTLVTEMQFKLLEILVTHAGEPVHTKAIATFVTGGNYNEDTTRKLVDGVIANIGKSFRAQGKKVPKDLKGMIRMPKHGHYVLGATGFVE
jgi:hypothetical protein